MDAAQALADLIEISTQIEAAVLVDSEGSVVATSVTDGVKADAFGRAARNLLAAVDESMSGARSEKVVQVQAVTPEGCVFVVRDDERMVAAVTVPDPTVGLVFYDLKTCLRHAAGEELAPKPKRREAPKQEEADGGT